MAQIYGDNLIAATESTQYVPADTAVIVRQLYELASSGSSGRGSSRRIRRTGWCSRFRCRSRTGTTLLRSSDGADGGCVPRSRPRRARVASDLRTFARTPLARNLLETRIVAIDSTIENIETLWIGRRSDELCGAISNSLRAGLDRTNELGQLLAQPLLIERLTA